MGAFDFVTDVANDITNTVKGNTQQGVTNLLGDALNFTSNFLSAGLIGYDQRTGKFGKGFTANAIDESIGEISGRNQARKQIMEQKDAIAAAAQQRQVELSQQKAQKAQQDLQASQYAGTVRAVAQAQKNNYLGGASASLSKDFLGL